jgi:anti-sigma regulatory factor (Ser/Thr protein kinase)
MSRSMPLLVTYPSVPTVVWIDHLIRATNRARSCNNCGLILDFSRLTRISPVFLCLIAATIEEGIRDRGNDIRIRFPERRRAADLLRRAKFFEEQPEKIESRFLQVRRLSRGRALSAHDVVELVAENLKISEGVRRLMNVLLSELFQNAVDHSGREFCYACAGMWGRSKQLHISVVDFGVGIPGRLRAMYQSEIGSHDTKALELVLKEARSTRERRVGGRGYGFIQEVLRANKGRLCIYSGHVRANYRFDRGEYPIVGKREFFGGTVVDIQINKDQESYYRIIDEQREVYF